MSKKANPTAIGIFVVAAALLCVFAVVVFDSSRLFSKKQKIVMYFDESVNGLDIGAPLKFKGVRIGQVTRIYLDFDLDDDRSSIPVVAEIDVHNFRRNLGAQIDITAPGEIKRMVEDFGLRARLQQSSFVTGLLFIELNYHRKAEPPRYVHEPLPEDDEDDDDMPPEIPTLPGNMAQMLQNVSSTLEQIGKMDLVGISEKTNSILAKVDRGLDEVQFDKINEELVGALSNMRDLTGNDNLREAFQKLGPMIAAATETLNGFNDTLTKLTELSGRLDNLLADDSPMIFELNAALEELSRAFTSLRVLSDYLERNPSSLFLGKQPAK